MKILIIGPSWVGDMVMSQSLYIRLKQQMPDAQIDVLAPAWCRPILERMPQVNKALAMPLSHGDIKLTKRYEIGVALRAEQYDKAYVLPNSAKSALIPFFAKIPKRIGWQGEMRYGLLNDLRQNKKSFQYMVERYVALAHDKKEMVNSGSLGGLDMIAPPSLDVRLDKRDESLIKHGLNLDLNVVGLCPGAEFGPAKQWPAKHYGELANSLINHNKQIWLFGSAKDQGVCAEILSHIDQANRDKIYDLSGKTDLVEVIDLLGSCESVVSNDSGLMHIAAATGAQVLGIYGSTSPSYTPPLAKEVVILHTDIGCRPCFKRVCPYEHMECLTQLLPSKVLAYLVEN